IQLKELKPQFDLIEPVPLPDPPVTSKTLPSDTAKVTAKSSAGAMQEQFSTMNINKNTKVPG
ncbi:unnamed protein product, partial [Rotaria sordida]